MPQRFQPLPLKLSLMLATLLLPCCNNPPGALELRLQPSKTSFLEGEPVRITATFSTKEGTVCINKPRANAFDVELRRLGSKEKIHQTSMAKCGTQAIFLLPLAPLLYVGQYVDVADVGRRFVLIDRERGHKLRLTLVGDHDNFVILIDGKPDDAGWERGSTPLPPGRYRLDVEFSGEESRLFPSPLFWSVYEQSVNASTEFTVAPSVPHPSASLKDGAPAREPVAPR